MFWDLSLVWAGIIAFAVFAYVVMDGFDLGVGILFPFFKDDAAKDQMMNSVAPVWDGNETWLVLGGGGLMAAFPLAYATIMPALYAPIIAMLLGLVFRGVAFEYRWRSRQRRHWWDAAFFLGSLTAAIAQGITLGALVQGIAVENRQYAGGWWDWLTPFSIFTGIAVAVGYTFLGAAWLAMKTREPIANRARTIALKGYGATLLCLALVSVWTPLTNTAYFERWFSWPTGLFTLVMPVLLVAVSVSYWRNTQRGNDSAAFYTGLGLFAVAFTGIGYTFFPFIVPPHLHIQETAAPTSSLIFMLVGAAILIPCIIAYTAYAYWVFRGRINPEDGYH